MDNDNKDNNNNNKVWTIMILIIIIWRINMKARAAALFDALDADGSGEIDDEEFIEGLTPGPV